MQGLSPRDLYVKLDQLREHWHADASLHTAPDSSEASYRDTRRQDALDLHERRIAVELRNLRRLIEQLPPRFYDLAIAEFGTLQRARISEHADWLGALTRLREIVSVWDNSRPPLVPCPECGYGVRGQATLRSHRLIVHGIEDAA